MSHEHLIGIPYDRSAGPVATSEELDASLNANCQQLVQRFFRDVYGVQFPREKMLSREGYLAAGRIVLDDASGIPLGDPMLRFGQVVYAVPRKNGFESIPVFDERELHMAVYLGIAGSREVREHFPESSSRYDDGTILLLHATNRNGNGGVSEIVDANSFAGRYLPIRAKEFLSGMQDSPEFPAFD